MTFSPTYHIIRADRIPLVPAGLHPAYTSWKICAIPVCQVSKIPCCRYEKRCVFMKNIPRYTLLFYTAFPKEKAVGLSLKKYYYNYNIEFHNNEDLHFKDFYSRRTFIFCDRDALIKKASQCGLPVIAVSHPFNKGESLFGTPYMIRLEEEDLPADLISPDFLEEIYCRYYRLPLQVGQSPNYILRELSMADLNDLIELDTDNLKNSDALFFPPEYMTSRLREIHCETFLKAYISNQYSLFNLGFYAVIDKKTRSFLGLVGFNTPEDDYIEIGYSLKKDYRRQGIGTEVLPVLLDYLSKLYPNLPIRVSLKKENTASRKLAEKFGIQCLIQ